MTDHLHFDHRDRPGPSEEELFNIAGRLGELHRAVQIAAAGTWPGTFTDMAADALLGPRARDLAEDDRRELMREARDSLYRVVDQLGLPPDRYPAQPATLPATDRTPRYQVWEDRLRDLPGDRRFFDQWPAPVRDHIITAAVEREAGIIAQEFQDYYDEVREDLPTWEWDAERLEATHAGGYREPPNEPDIDGFLDEAQSEVEPFLDHLQVQAVTEWIDQQLRTLTERGWTVDHVQDYTQDRPTWHLDHERQRMAVHTQPHAEMQVAGRRFSAAEAAAYPELTGLIADAVTRTPPSPVTAAFPAQTPRPFTNTAAAAAIAAMAAADESAAVEPPSSGPQR